MSFYAGQAVVFNADRGTRMRAVVTATPTKKHPTHIEIQINKDPFPVEVEIDRVERAKTMPEQTPLKALRRQAREAKIDDWETLNREELEGALSELEEAEDEDESDEEVGNNADEPEEASDDDDEETEMPTATAKRPRKVTAKKAAVPAKATTAKSGVKTTNPFREGSNLYHITEALITGGKRSDLVKQLKPKLNFNPRAQNADDFDPDVEIDRRLKVVGYILRDDHGFTYVHEGRGTEATIKAVPPKTKR